MRAKSSTAIAAFFSAVLFAASASMIPVAAHATEHMDLPSQPLDEAIQAVARKINVNILVHPGLVRGRRSPALTNVSVDEALTMVLAGTGLTTKMIDEKTVAVVEDKPTASSSPAPAWSVTGSGGNDNLRLAQLESAAGAQAEAAGEAAKNEPGNSTRDRDNDSKSSDEDSRPSLQEVIVTATKRAQRLQDVPLSITVVSAEDISQRQLVGAEDYLRGIPGVNQVGQPVDGAGIVIRGLETSPVAQNFASGPTVATYFGETPTTNSAGLGGGSNVDIKLVDIERIEVLRGPQGTAFGSSSIGGAVRVIPAAPRVDRLEANVGIGYSATSGTGDGNDMAQAMVNIPLLADKVAIRATAYKFQNSGLYRNNAASDPDIQSLARTYGVEDLATAQDEEVGASRATGGRFSALVKASDDLRFTFTYLTQKTEMDGLAQATRSGFNQAGLYISPEARVRGQRNGLSDNDIDLFNALLEYDLGWGDLLATYSHIDAGSRWIDNWGTLLQLPISNPSRSQHKENSGEVRVVTRLDGPVNFLGGIYGEKQEDQGLWTYYWDGTPALNPFGPGQQGLFSEYLDRRDLEQKAVFGEVSWKLLRALTLTVGGRYYEYDRSVQVDATGAIFGGTHTDDNAKASGTSFRSNLKYQPSDNVMVYAAWAQGFRLGKPQPGLPPSLCDVDGDGLVDGTSTPIAATRELKSDDVNSFEIGGKTSLLDRRLTIDTALYRINWSGVPFFVYAPPPPDGCALAYNANAGRAASEGIELQTSFQTTPALRVDGGLSWIHARLTEDAPSLGGVSGDRLPGSPEFNANLGLQYGFDVGGHEALVRANSIYVGPFYSGLQRLAESRAGDYVKVDLSARVVLDKLSVDLYVHNLTDADNYTWRGAPTPQYLMQPRTIGVQLGYSF